MSKAAARMEMRPTNDYTSMVALARKSGLETTSLTNVLAAYGFYLGDDLVGCACLRQSSGIFMIECLAVDDRMRGKGLGSILVIEIEHDAREIGVKKLWAIARQPAFFEKNGYLRTSGSEPDGPRLRDCESCSQYLRDCHPAIMLKYL